MGGRIVQLIKVWDTRVRVERIWGVFDLVLFNAILRLLDALVSK